MSRRYGVSRGDPRRNGSRPDEVGFFTLCGSKLLSVLRHLDADLSGALGEHVFDLLASLN
jgi:hypothetical protein